MDGVCVGGGGGTALINGREKSKIIKNVSVAGPRSQSTPRPEAVDTASDSTISSTISAQQAHGPLLSHKETRDTVAGTGTAYAHTE